MTDDTTNAGTADVARGATPVWLVAAISAAFGLFYAYAVWNAIGNLVAAVQTTGEQGLSLNGLGWFLWLFAAAFPILVWAVAFWVGRRRRPHELLLVMLAGLALVAVFWLNVVSYSTVNTSSLVG